MQEQPVRLKLPSAVGIKYLAPVKVTALESVDKRLGSSDIGGNGDIVYVAKTEQIHLVWLMGLGRKRISEEKQQVYLVAGNAGADLLVTALRAAEIALDVKSRCLGNKLSGSTRSTKIMLGEYTAVCNTELY